MNIRAALGLGAQIAKRNAPAILATAAGVGVITTAYLTGKAAIKASRKIEQDQETPYDSRKALIHNAKLVWKDFIPAGVSGVVTLGCIVGAQRAAGSKTLAATTALAVTERAYVAYRDKIVEEFGERKDQAIRDQVVADEVERRPPGNVHVLSGPGQVTCCEMWTGRYFICDMETLRKAENDLNAHMLGGTYATMDYFYDLLDLDHTPSSGQQGWECSKLMQLKFTAILHEGKPVLAFDYNYVKSL